MHASYTQPVRLRKLHSWDLTPSETIDVQKRLAARVVNEGGIGEVRFVGAADVAYVDRRWPRQPSLARAAIVLMAYPSLEVVERHVVEAPVTFPYVPGLLSFREIPVLARAFEQLEVTPDLLLADGGRRPSAPVRSRLPP